MNLDFQTVAVIVAISAMLQSIVLIFLWFLANKYQGISTFTIGRILSATGFMVASMRSLLPPLFTIFLANVFLLAAISLSCVGVGQFVGRKNNYAYLIGLNATFALIQIYFLYINDNFFARAFSLSLFSLPILFLTAYYLAKCRDRNFLASARFTLVVVSTFTMLGVARAILLLKNPPTSIFEPNLSNAIAFIGTFAFGFLWTGGFMMMVTQRLYQELYILASVDMLTQSLNRRSMQQHLNYEALRFERTKTPFSLILLDVDFFKRINDTYGHDGGDLVLTHLANILQQKLRSYDRLSRWGGEEFLVLLPETSLQKAEEIAERLRATVEENPAGNGTIHNTISLGVAEIAKHGNSVTSLITAADRALYQAKQTGRNCVVVASNGNS
ncbi:GGDEF domain-containing protein [Tumidithrix elongata RA019]|uniref:GGDEF domain-containing protein n=1 Tax=Tumidithrix elongata BACA0141 TaxID=2716417 RepID=A0AAW9Q3S9_9CYAN|nr:GGDEF domain-containing protein [Tumidithrix elongata RA019]